MTICTMWFVWKRMIFREKSKHDTPPLKLNIVNKSYENIQMGSYTLIQFKARSHQQPNLYNVICMKVYDF